MHRLSTEIVEREGKSGSPLWISFLIFPETVCGTVCNIGREGEEYQVMTLKELRDRQVDMFTTVFIGNSQTKEINGKMVTPRGYKDV